MNTILNVETKKSFYIFTSAVEHVASDNTAIIDGRLFNMTNIEIVEDVTLPADWEPLKYTLAEGVWAPVKGFMGRSTYWKDHARNLMDFEAQAYARDRASAYPSLTEQADMQYWDALNGTTTWVDAISAIKAEFPKPE